MFTISVFSNTFGPFLEVPNAPAGKERLQYPAANMDFKQLLQMINSGRFEDKIEEVTKKGYKENKKLLPCFTPAGVFRLRLDNELVTYSQTVCLDYDNVESVFRLKQKAIADPHTLAAFYSPSMAGLKLFVRVNTAAGQHETAFNQAKAYYDHKLGHCSDTRVKNLSRLCFVSADRDTYYNEDAKVYEVNYNVRRVHVPRAAAFTFQFLQDFTAAKAGAYSSQSQNRNEYIFLFANNCNRYGIEQELALQFAESIWQQDNKSFNYSELKGTVKSAYGNTHEHGKFIVPNKFQKSL
jgi:hypothetical protein